MREYFINGIFKSYTKLQIVSLKLDDPKLIDYLDFNSFTGEIETSWITKEMWAISKEELELKPVDIFFNLKKAIKRLK